MQLWRHAAISKGFSPFHSPRSNSDSINAFTHAPLRHDIIAGRFIEHGDEFIILDDYVGGRRNIER